MKRRVTQALPNTTNILKKLQFLIILLLVIQFSIPNLAVAEYKVSYKVDTAACNKYVEEVEKYAWNVATVMQIMKAESSCNPKAINAKDSHKGCNGSYNLMQVACIHYNKGERKDDIALNIKIAYDVYKRAGYSFRPWTTCKAIKNCA